MIIYIIHYKKLKDRYLYLKEALKNYSVEWIDFYDRDKLTPNELSWCNESLWSDRVVEIYRDAPPPRPLSSPEICNSLSHIEALKRIAFGEFEFGLVLEDDVILKQDFENKFQTLLGQTPLDYGLIFLGNAFSMKTLNRVGCNPSKEIKITPNIYEKTSHPKTRTVDAYIIKKEAAQSLVEKITKICLPFDFELSYFIQQLDLKVYWWDPGLIYQGSQIGRYRSSIR